MTLEEAIFYLANMDRKYMEEGMSEALDMAIKALEQEPCGDVIRRQEALNAITMAEVRWQAVDAVNKLPSVTPQQRTGRWIHREDMDYLDKNKVVHNHFICQDCGFIHDFIDGHTAQYKYCPNCGAKMEVEE